MIGALRSEFLKLTTVRLWWVLLLTLFGYVGFTSGLLAGVFGALGDQLATSPITTVAARMPSTAMSPSAVAVVSPVV